MRLLAVLEATSVSGPAKNLLEFATLARPMGVEVVIAAIARGAETNTFIEAAQQADIHVELIKERRVFDRMVVPSLSGATARIAPDIIQTHAVKSHFLVRYAGIPRITMPWVAFHHGYTQPAARVRLYNQLDRWSLRTAQKIVTVSAPFRDELIRAGVHRDRIEIVHNAIDPDWECAARMNSAGLRAGLGIPEDSPVILSVGRLSKEKDHLTLLEAVRRLPSETHPRVVVVGDGPERAAIEGAISRLGLQASVTVTGHQDTVAPYYGIARVLVISSLSEGSPNVLLEAMASGVPVIATRVGGIPEHVEEGKSALLVPPGDPAAMSAAIARVIADQSLAHGLTSRSQALVRERHSPKERALKLVETYKSVLDRSAIGSGV